MQLRLVNFPVIFALLTLLIMWASAQLGTRIFPSIHMEEREREEFNIVLGATLTLLGLIIGFAFSMAVGRYDQRKAYEEEEANAIGTEYVRADLLPAAAAEKVRPLLKDYLEKRIVFFQTRNWDTLQKVNSETSTLQNEMWSIVAAAAQTQPTPVTALAVAGMNDVLNRQGYTQAAWWNRIPVAAWALMGIIAIFSNLLMGFAARDAKSRRPLLVLPLILSFAFLLLADLDSPRGGLIRVRPQNLLALETSLK